MIVYRHCDPRLPFLWESLDQPEARWHGQGEGPVQYFADTPDGAWAEFLRHEGITQESELVNVRRALWAIEAPADRATVVPDLPDPVLRGGLDSYRACRREALRLRKNGVSALHVPSAALEKGEAGGWKVDRGLQRGPARDGFVYVLFGTRPDLIAWPVTVAGRPRSDLLTRVRHFG